VTPFTALVLAGTRAGGDPVAAHARVSHKGLIRLGGMTLLERVLRALEQAGASRIAVSTDDAGILSAIGKIRLAVPVDAVEAAGSPAASVLKAAEGLVTPLLVTTSDHALLHPDWVTRFIADAPTGADVAVLLAPRGVVEDAAPGTARTYLKLRDGRYSGCNLFLLRTPAALAGIALWRRVETYRKQPWKIALMLGPAMLIGYLAGLLTLNGAIRRLGRLAGIEAAAVLTPYGLAAVDVDKPADIDLVRKITGLS
jgi:molybdopterin-guanine dinucleotide biosynthesis protein A